MIKRDLVRSVVRPVRKTVLGQYYLSDVFGDDLISAFSLVDLGNQRGSVDSAFNPVVRQRRLSDSATLSFPAPIGDDLLSWLAGSNSTTPKLYDQSGSDNDAVKVSNNNEPALVTSGAIILDSLGNKALSFDGTDDYFQTAAGSLLGGNLTLQIVASFSDSQNDVFEFGGWADNGGWILMIRDTGVLFRSKQSGTANEYYGVSSANDYVDGTPHLFTLIIKDFTTSPSISLFVDGVEISLSVDTAKTGTYGESQTNGAIGKRRTGGDVAGMKLSCLNVWDADKSTQRADIESLISTWIKTPIS